MQEGGDEAGDERKGRSKAVKGKQRLAMIKASQMNATNIQAVNKT